MLTVNDKDKEKRPLTDIVREVKRNQMKIFSKMENRSNRTKCDKAVGKKNKQTEKYIKLEQAMSPIWGI